jgi:transposase InsO family protein
LFRYRLVSEVASRLLRGEDCADIVRDVVAQDHPDLSGRLRRVSERTLYRWLAQYKEQGFVGLLPAPRRRVERSVVLKDGLLDFICAQKAKDPQASLPELIRRARETGSVLRPHDRLDRTTLYRALKRMGAYVGRRRRRRPDRDTRRFQYPHRMQMLLCDGKHFRAGVARARRVALFFLDDASRYGLDVVVGTSESASLFLGGLYQTSRRYGIADIYYLDRGPGFIAEDTFEVVRKLGALLVHGEAAYPEGHGKIEKFNQTAKHDLLRGYDGRADIDPDPNALSLRLQHYLREVYNHRPHESLGGATPYERFRTDERPLRMPQSDEELRSRFVLHIKRTVTADHTVSVDSVDCEIPRGHAGEQILVHHRLLDDSLAVLHDGRLVDIHPVDLHANARARRARARDNDTQNPLPRSAADLAFERDFLPVVDPDGGLEE